MVESGSGSTERSSDRRKLVAVVYADMAGYSRLIGLDDAGTLQRLRALRQNLIDPAIEEHGGRIIQTGGDSLLIAFDSIDGAVRCAARYRSRFQSKTAISQRIVPSAFAWGSTWVTRLRTALTCTGMR